MLIAGDRLEAERVVIAAGTQISDFIERAARILRGGSRYTRALLTLQQP